VISTLLSWLWLGESLVPVEIAAMALTLGGVAWVVLERRRAATTTLYFPGDGDRQVYLKGVLLGLCAALSQASGLLLSKRGLEGGFSPISATLMRMLVGTVVMWLLTLATGRARATGQALRDRRALALIAGGALTGPFLGVWLSMVALQGTLIGIASTLMALPPVFLIPLTYRFFGERITLRAVVGTLVAVAGVALIFLA
jgi:drug/metabolite transporter (DMT)-like permease